MDAAGTDQGVMHPGGALVPLEGGFSGETFLADAVGEEQAVVRIYGERSAARGPNAAEVDAAVLRLVRGLLPVPAVLEVRRADPAAGTPALLVTSYLEGARLDLLLPEASARLRERVARSLGDLLARLCQMPMLRQGVFLDGDLTIGPPPPGADDLADWVGEHLEGSALEAWPQADVRRLVAVADQAQDLVDTVRRACLVHGDLNPKNVLVDPGSGAVTGLVDWELAHAGHPMSDLGNLLRFERDPVFSEAVVGTYVERVPDAPRDRGEICALARAADLSALVELASRRGQSPLSERAHDRLRAIARTGDLHATA